MDIKHVSIPTNTYAKGRREKVWLGVIHYVSAVNIPGYEKDPYNLDAIANRIFIELAAKYQFSCHDMIGRKGKVINFLDVADTSYNAGKSVIGIPKYKKGLNNCSYSIELVCKKGDQYTEAEYQVAAKLAALREKQIVDRGLGKIVHWVGHDWISGAIAYRLRIRDYAKIKIDPGPTFNWSLFHEMLWEEKLRDKITTDVRKAYEYSQPKPLTLKDFSTSALIGGLIKRLTGKKG